MGPSAGPSSYSGPAHALLRRCTASAHGKAATAQGGGPNWSWGKKILCPTSAVFEREDLRTVAAFLVGFEIFRMADGRTYGHRDSSWEKNIYCYLHQ